MGFKLLTELKEWKRRCNIEIALLRAPSNKYEAHIHLPMGLLSFEDGNKNVDLFTSTLKTLEEEVNRIVDEKISELKKELEDL